jgi:hypothetical protein
LDNVLALARGSRPRSPGAPVAFVGEAKHRDRRPGLAELHRLQHLRDLLTASGHTTVLHGGPRARRNSRAACLISPADDGGISLVANVIS